MIHLTNTKRKIKFYDNVGTKMNFTFSTIKRTNRHFGLAVDAGGRMSKPKFQTQNDSTNQMEGFPDYPTLELYKKCSICWVLPRSSSIYLLKKLKKSTQRRKFSQLINHRRPLTTAEEIQDREMAVHEPLVLVAVLSLTMVAGVELPMNWVHEYSNVSQDEVSRNEITLNHFSIQNVCHFLQTSTVNVNVPFFEKRF